MRSPALEKQNKYCQPSQHEEQTEDDHDGKRASGMLKILVAISDVGGFR